MRTDIDYNKGRKVISTNSINFRDGFEAIDTIIIMDIESIFA